MKFRQAGQFGCGAITLINLIAFMRALGELARLHCRGKASPLQIIQREGKKTAARHGQKRTFAYFKEILAIQQHVDTDADFRPAD